MQRKSGPQAYPTKDSAYKSPFARYQQLPINNNTSTNQNQNVNRNNMSSLAFNRISSDNSTQSFGEPLMSLPGSRNQLVEPHSRFRPPSPLLIEPEPVDIFSFNFDIIENENRNGQTDLKDKKKPQNKPVKHKIGKALPESLNTLDSIDQQGRQGDNVRERKKPVEQDIPKEKITANKFFIPTPAAPPANKTETKENIDIKEGLKRAILQDVNDETSIITTSSSRRSSKQRLTEEEILSTKMKASKDRVQNAINKRRYFRFCVYLLYLAIIGVVVGLACLYLIKDGTLTYNAGTSFLLTLDNCTLNILDHNDSNIDNPIYFKYHIPTKLEAGDLMHIKTNSSGNTENIYVRNNLETRYCKVDMFIRPATPIQSFDILCSRCNITQDNSFPFQVSNLFNVTGEVVHSNFRNLQVDRLFYLANTGYLQLNNIISNSGNNIITLYEQGDIIIQSTNDFQLNAATDTQAFCLNAPSVNQISSTNCSILGQNATAQFAGNPECQLVYDLCTQSGCATPTTRYVVTSNTGNIYANVIPAVGQPVSLTDSDLVMGQIYQDGIKFSPQANQTILGFDELVADDTKGNPFILFNLGSVESRSSKYSKWVISSTTSYSLIRPWWIGTLSATILNGYMEEVNGFLLPGFCPFTAEYTTRELLQVQNLINANINVSNSLVTFVEDDSLPLPPKNPEPSSGVFQFATGRNPFDNWYTLAQSPSGNIVLDNRDYSESGDIIAAVALSLVIGAFIAYLVLSILIEGINMACERLFSFANHLQSYARLEHSKTQRSLERLENRNHVGSAPGSRGGTSPRGVQAKTKWPSTLSFIDYIFFMTFKHLSSSASQFYKLLFKPVDYTEIDDEEEQDISKFMIKATEAKVLYEKFCFINHLNEERLIEGSNQDILRKYGFEIITRKDKLTQVLTNINIQNYDNFIADSLAEGDYSNSLERYMAQNVLITNFPEDQVEIDTFIKVYNSFCDYNRLPRVNITSSLMKEKFNLNLIFVPQQYITKLKYGEDDFLQNYDRSFIQKIIDWFASLTSARDPKKTYIIDTSRLENHFNFALDKIIDSPEELADATVNMILYSGWRVADLIIVLLHMLVGALLTIPLILLVMLNESQYEPWSLKNPENLIQWSDFVRDPARLIHNLYDSFTWNIVIMVIVSILVIVYLVSVFLYYAVMEFPQEKAFKNYQDKPETFLQKSGRLTEWGLVLLALGMYFGYLGVLLTWLLLGAFINPNAFLPFATAAVTFVLFVIAKYRSMRSLSANGKASLSMYLNTLFGGYINNLLERLTENAGSVAQLATDKGKVLVQSSTFKAVTGKLADTGIIDQETLNQYTQQIESLDPNSLAKSAINYATNPALASQQLEKLQDSLKEKALQKIKEECRKRKIPESLVDLIIAISQKDNEAVTQALTQVLSSRNKMSKESIEIIIELLFPQYIDKEETVLFITTKIAALLYNHFDLSEIPGLTAEIFLEIFNNYKHLQENRPEMLVKTLRDIAANLQVHSPFKEIDFFMPALDIVSNLAKDEPDYWTIKDSSLNLLNSSVDFLSGEGLLLGNNNVSKGNNKVVKDFVKLLALLSSGYEVPYDLETKDFLKSQDVLRILSNFCSSTGLEQLCKDLNVPRKFVFNWIYLVFCYARQETQDLPKDILSDLASMLKLKVSNKTEFLSFCFSLSSAVFNSPRSLFKKIDACADHFGISGDLQEFFKVLTCYSFEEELQYPAGVMFEKNPYSVQLAKSLLLTPLELKGFVDFLYNKDNTRSFNAFMEIILNKMGLKKDVLDAVKPLIYLVSSQNEATLLQAVKSLSLENEKFLLVGKRILNPKFISATLYEEVGITNKEVIDEKDTIDNASEDDFQYWKDQLRKEVNDALIRKKYTMQPEAYETFKSQANLVKLYLTNWETFTWTKKYAETLVQELSNPQNELRKKLLTYDKGALYNGVDFLTTIMTLKCLKVTKGKRYLRLDKEKEYALTMISGYLNIEIEPVNNFLKMFVFHDIPEIIKSFLFFFPAEENKTQVLKRLLKYSFKQILNTSKQINFLNERFPAAIEISQDDVASPFPPNLLKKMFFENSPVILGVSDIQSLSALLLRNLSIPIQDGALRDCNTITLFAKGLLPSASLSEKLKIQDTTTLKLFNILSQTNSNVRLTMLTELFESPQNPIKVVIALYGLLTRQNFKIRHASTSHRREYEEESIKLYLSKILNVHPDIFILFDVAFEKDVSKFIQKSLPLIKRLTGTAVDVDLMESLFSLSLGEPFDSTYLATKLDISPNVIHFLTTLTKIAFGNVTETDISKSLDDLAVKEALLKLKIENTELSAITKLAFNFSGNDDLVNEILTGLNLKKPSTSIRSRNVINIDLARRLLRLTAPINPKTDIFRVKEKLAENKSKLTSLFNSLDLSNHKDNAFIIFRLAAGQFLAIQEYSQQLSWMFPPSREVETKTAVINLNMAFSGLLNPNVEKYQGLYDDVFAFIKKFSPGYEEEFSFKAKPYKPTDEVLPNNTLAYAIYLAHHTMDISPFWVQAFFFGKKAFTELKARVRDLESEFIITVVLNFINMPDMVHDILGLMEWNKNCRAFYTAAAGKTPEPLYRNNNQEIYEYFGSKFVFDFEKTKKLASKSGLLNDAFWKKIFDNPGQYNFNVNKSILALLSMKHTLEQKSAFIVQLKPLLKSPPNIFITELCSLFYPSEGLRPFSETRVLLGQMIEQAIVRAYKLSTRSLYQRNQRLPGFILTNLSMLGTIITLRESGKSKMSFNRMLYNLNQLVTNFERKIYLDDNFFKMSKFKLMKIAGISLGMQIGNIVEWCLPPSLLKNEYAIELDTAATSEARMAIKVKQCEEVVFNYNDNKNIVGDIGRFDGHYMNYRSFLNRILEFEDWNQTDKFLCLHLTYMGGPNNGGDSPYYKKATLRGLFWKCQTQNNNVYLSKELVSLMYDDDGENDFDDGPTPRNEFRMQPRRLDTESPLTPILRDRQRSKEERITSIKKQEYEIDRENQDPNLPVVEEKKSMVKKKLGGVLEKFGSSVLQNGAIIDIKTKLPYKALVKKSEDFENALLHPKMRLIQVFGDPSVLIRGNDRIITRGERELEEAKIYMALVGLQGILGKTTKDRKLLKEYIGILTNRMRSDPVKLEEIVTFFMTGKPVLREIIYTLQIGEHVVDFLFMSIKENADMMRPSDNEDEENQFFVSEVMNKASDITASEFNAFKMIRNIYQFKREGDLIQLVEELRKDNDKRTKEGDIKTRLLIKLIKMLTFIKWKEDCDSFNSPSQQSNKGAESRYKNDILTMIFEEIISDLYSISSEDLDKEILIKAHQVIQGIIKRDFSYLFETLILAESAKLEKVEKKPTLEQNPLLTVPSQSLKNDQQPLLEKIMDLFGANSLEKNNTRLMRIFLTLASGDLSAFKSRRGYKTAINGVVEDLVELQFFEPLNHKKDVSRKLCQLLVGTLTWDVELIIKALITEITLKEAYFLYNLQAYLKLTRNPPDPADNAQAELHLKVVFSALWRRTTNKPGGPGDIINMENTEDLGSLLKQELGTGDSVILATSLNEKVEKLGNFASKSTKPPKAQQFYKLSQAFENSAETEQLTSKNQDYQLFAQIMTGACEGTIVTRLLQTFVQNDGLRNLLLNLGQFIVKLTEKLLIGQGKKTGNAEIFKYFEFSMTSLQSLVRNDLWSRVLIIAPSLMKMYLFFQYEGNLDIPKMKLETLCALKKLAMKIKSPEQTELIYDLIAVSLGTNIRNLDEKNPGDSIEVELGGAEKTQIYFNSILPSIFPNINSTLTTKEFEIVHSITTRLGSDFKLSLDDPQKRKKTARELIRLLSDLQIFDMSLINSVFSLIEGDFENCKEIVGFIIPGLSPEAIDKILSYLNQAKSVLKIDFGGKSMMVGVNERASSTNYPEKEMDITNWELILKKVKEGTASSRDLFQILDNEGDKSGTISEQEFQVLANRLGLNLSPHRIKEIFAKIKGSKVTESAEHELNEKEFEKALAYVQDKTLTQALFVLGITPERLTGIFIKLTVLLILIFVFIFIGIKAFTIGGTFSSIVGSIFAAIGGIGLGKDKESEKDKLNPKKVEKAADTAFDITATEKL